MNDLLAPALREYIEKNLGKATLNKIEERLAQRHGIGVCQAIKEFSKLDDVLHEIFGAGAQELEAKFIHTIKTEQVKLAENWESLKISLVASIQKSIEDNLGKSTLNKIESRLMERYSLKVSQSIEDFGKFESVLKEFFGAGSNGLKSRLLQNIIREDSLKKAFDNLTVQEQALAQEFLKSFAEKDKTLLQSFSITQLA